MPHKHAGAHIEEGTKGLTAPGGLTINGDYLQETGVLEITVIGPGQAGKLTTTGGMTFTGGSVEFRFEDGYLPRAGDSVQFLEPGAGQSVVTENLETEYCGAGEGLAILLAEGSDGSVSFVADSDAEPSEVMFDSAFEDSDLESCRK